MTQTVAEKSHLDRLVARDTSLSIEIFDIPNSRLVHGNAFPLGIKPKGDLVSADLETSLKYISSLADKGVFNEFLTKCMALPYYFDNVIGTNQSQMELYCFAGSQFGSQRI